MDAEWVGNFKQDSPEWHEARVTMIGASDVPSILGIGYKSAYTLWCEKHGLIEPKEPDEKLKRKFAYGHHMEPFVAGIFAERHPELHVQETGTWRNRKRVWQGCNPDRLLALDHIDAPDANFHSVLEIKTFSYLEEWAEQPPANNRAQLLWQLDTFGFHKGYLAGYANVSGDYVEYEIEADPFELECIRSEVWDWAQRETPPEIDGSFDTYETIRRLNPSLIRGREVQIPTDIALRYTGANLDLKAAERELNKWKGHLLAHMGTAQYAVYGEKRIASRVAVKDGVPYLKET